MKSVQLAEFKARFCEMIDAVRVGETVVVAYGRSQEKVAALIPYAQLPVGQPRRLGVLAGRAKVARAEDFALSDEEFLGE